MRSYLKSILNEEHQQNYGHQETAQIKKTRDYPKKDLQLIFSNIKSLLFPLHASLIKITIILEADNFKNSS